MRSYTKLELMVLYVDFNHMNTPLPNILFPSVYYAGLTLAIRSPLGTAKYLHSQSLVFYVLNNKYGSSFIIYISFLKRS